MSGELNRRPKPSPPVVHDVALPINKALHPTPALGGGMVTLTVGQPPIQLVPDHSSRSASIEVLLARSGLDVKSVPGGTLMKQESMMTWAKVTWVIKMKKEISTWVFIVKRQLGGACGFSHL